MLIKGVFLLPSHYDYPSSLCLLLYALYNSYITSTHKDFSWDFIKITLKIMSINLLLNRVIWSMWFSLVLLTSCISGTIFFLSSNSNSNFKWLGHLVNLSCGQLQLVAFFFFFFPVTFFGSPKAEASVPVFYWMD